MSKLLIIAEKPSVATDIARVLMKGVTAKNGVFENSKLIISSAFGHLVQLDVKQTEENRYWSLEDLPLIPNSFSLNPINSSGSVARLKLLMQLIKRSDVTGVVNACDAGREGELIFRLIYDFCGTKKPIHRMWLQSMTATAISDAYTNMKPGKDFDNLYHAARSRAKADWLIGINATRALTVSRQQTSGEKGLTSAGRVQSPTLALLVKRELEIREFVSEDFYEIHGIFSVKNGTYTAKWIRYGEDLPDEDKDEENATSRRADRIFDKNVAKSIIEEIKDKKWVVTDESTKVTRRAPNLFDLTTLQREANRRFRFTADKTLKTAQSLYEKHKVLSYPRTDSRYLPEDYEQNVRKILAEIANHYPEIKDKFIVDQKNKQVFDNTKISDHYAIIPTGSGSHISQLSEDEKRIYDLVCRRFIAAFLPAAIINKTIRISVNGNHSFKCVGQVVEKAGWLTLFRDENKEDPELCPVTNGEEASLTKHELKESKTNPPSRYTDATLLRAMETAARFVEGEELAQILKDRGLGTPATRASIIEELLSPNRGYATRKGVHIIPTDKGIDTVLFMKQCQAEMLISPQLTGEWEGRLSDVEKGKLSETQFLKDVSVATQELITNIKSKKIDVKKKLISAPCPLCQGEVAVTRSGFSCEKCNWFLKNAMAGRLWKEKEVETLLKTGKTEKLNGFKSTKGKSFNAYVVLDKEGKTTFDFR